MPQSSDSKATWLAARELFFELADLEAAERDSQLQALGERDPELCKWVERLLGHDPGEESSVTPRIVPEEAFGAYRAVRLIAVGGMGEVYLARRTDGEFEREVALKCLRPGRASERLAQRFLRERQTLARLDHEYIAGLLDGGTTESGKPFLVLEYVEGQHIDDYCRSAKLSVRERVELFLLVLEAVEHSHVHGVIHRDLKPSNILIRADGKPRLLDFGISRTADTDDANTPALTGTGQRLFTPEFASPEQVRGGEVTVVSDVFSLGVVLYLLLAEVGPWDGSGSLHELEDRLLNREPAPPSRAQRGTARRAIAGDLDTIVLSCLEKSPHARPRSVRELSEELRRFLDGFPIKTRPPRATGRLLRFAKRNPWQSLSAVALVLFGIASFFAWEHFQLAEQQRDPLQESLFTSLEHAQQLGNQDRYPESADALLEFLERIEGLEGQEVLRGRALASLARAYVRTNRARKALEVAREGLEFSATLEAGNSDIETNLAITASSACQVLGDSDSALEYAERAYRCAQEFLEAGHSFRLETYEAVAAMSKATRSQAERIELLSRGIEEARDRDRPQDPALASLLNLKGVLLTENEEFEAAILCFDEALPIERWNHGDGHGGVAMMRAERANCLRLLERYDEALPELEAALLSFDARGHRDLSTRVLALMGMLKLSRGEFELAIEDLGESKLAYAELRGPQAPICYHLEALIADCLQGMDLLEEARASYEDALQAPTGVTRQGPVIEAQTRYGYAALLMKIGERQAARAQVEQVVALRRQAYGAEAEPTQEAVTKLAEFDQ